MSETKLAPHPPNINKQDDPEILTALEAAALLRCGLGTIYALVRRKKIPFIKLGRLVRFNREALLSLKGGSR